MATRPQRAPGTHLRRMPIHGSPRAHRTVRAHTPRSYAAPAVDAEGKRRASVPAAPNPERRPRPPTAINSAAHRRAAAPQGADHSRTGAPPPVEGRNDRTWPDSSKEPIRIRLLHATSRTGATKAAGHEADPGGMKTAAGTTHGTSRTSATTARQPETDTEARTDPDSGAGSRTSTGNTPTEQLRHASSAPITAGGRRRPDRRDFPTPDHEPRARNGCPREYKPHETAPPT